MTPTNPYLLRAIHAWIVDNGCTPHLVVDATVAQVIVPRSFVEDGSIVLNIAPGAVRNLDLGNDRVTFTARFGGVAHDISVPVAAIRAVYARENGQGILLPNAAAAESGAQAKPAAPDGPRPPHLTVVK